MTSGISYHVIYDGIHNHTQQLIDHITIMRPRVINIVGGAMKREAFVFAKNLKVVFPNMRVIFRNYPDDGNHAVERYKLITHRDDSGKLIVDDASGCQRWVDDNAEYLSAGLTVLTDNESVRDDLDVYAEWQARVMELCTPKQWALAVGRFATGNPRENQYAQLTRMYQALSNSMGLHTWSPNEYMSKKPEWNGGNVQRYENGYKQCEKIPCLYPVTSIGEWGICYSPAAGQLDPYKGYKSAEVGMGGKATARFYIDQWKAWYRPLNVDVCLYCWGAVDQKWQTFRVDNDPELLAVLEAAARSGELEPITSLSKPPEVIPVPPAIPPAVEVFVPPTNEQTKPRRYRLQQTRNIRTMPSGTAPIVQELPMGKTILVYEGSRRPGLVGDMWHDWLYGQISGGIVGWISITGIQWTEANATSTGEIPVVIPPPATDTPPPAPAPVETPTAPFFEVSRDFCLKMQAHHQAIADLWGSLLNPMELPRAA